MTEPGGGGTYELTVAGSLGPVLRGVLPASRVETVETTTIRLEESAGRTLAELVALLESWGIQVQAAYRLTDCERTTDLSASPVLDDAGAETRA